MNDLEMIEIINKFPIGGIPTNREELLSKIAVISYLARYEEQFSPIENIDERELIVKRLLGELLMLKEGETIPSLSEAEKTLKLSNGFLKDFGKVQYIKENNPNFDKTYNAIANNLRLINESPKKAR